MHPRIFTGKKVQVKLVPISLSFFLYKLVSVTLVRQIAILLLGERTVLETTIQEMARGSGINHNVSPKGVDL